MRLIVTLLAAYLTMSLSIVDNNSKSFNSCNAQLVVENNRSSKSADNEGAQFILELTNTSSTSEIFQLSVENFDGNCKKGNPKHKLGSFSLNQNIKLDLELQNSQFQRLNQSNSSRAEIELNSGESYKFIVDVQVPSGTAYNVWSCVQVKATTDNCKSLSETKTLSVFVVDPSKG